MRDETQILTRSRCLYLAGVVDSKFDLRASIASPLVEVERIYLPGRSRAKAGGGGVSARERQLDRNFPHRPSLLQGRGDQPAQQQFINTSSTEALRKGRRLSLGTPELGEGGSRRGAWKSASPTFGVCFQTGLYSLANSGRNQHAQTNHLLQCDRTRGYSSINISRGFRYGMGSNHSAASAAAI